MRIVLTRQPAQAGHIEAGLEQLGYHIDFLPLTDFQLPQHTATLDAMVEGLHNGIWQRVLLTSPNTIRALIARGWDPAHTETRTAIAVTGPGTARVLYDYGAQHTPWMPQHDASAAGILNQFPPGPGTIALPQGAAAGSAMRTGLNQLGWCVTHTVAYQTVDYPADPARALLPAHSDALKPEDLTDDDVVILTAPTAARRWAHIQVPVRAVVAIGQPTRRVAQQAAIELAATAASPDTAGLAAAVDRL